MRRPSLPVLAAVASCLMTSPHAGAAGDERPAGGAARAGLELALHYDLYVSEGSHLSDASGKGRDGVLRGGEIVFGKRKNALRFDGRGVVLVGDSADPLRPEGRALTVGALCNPAAPDGVLVAMGDARDGFSLYLKGGIPHFAVRSSGALTEVADLDPLPLDQWCHLVGTIDARGEVSLLVNGWPVRQARGRLVAATPAGPLAIGADPGSPVGRYASPSHWRGLIEDVRLYWGFMDREANLDQLKDWADMPGCGCGD